jgi:hypothetical protein
VSKTYKFDRYVEDAKVEPFTLELSEDEVLEIPPPDGETVLEIEEATSSRVMLELLCGEHYDRVWELIRHRPASVLNGLARDIGDHFGLSSAPPGGFPRSSR